MLGSSARAAGAILLREAALVSGQHHGDQPKRCFLFSRFGGGWLPGRSFGEDSTSPEESASRRPGDVPQGLTLWLSLTGLLQDWGGGLCEGPESGGEEDSESIVAFFWIFKSALRVSASSLPHGVDRPARLHRCRRCGAGAHQHGAVDVGCNYQDAEEDGPDDGALQTQIVRAACHC